jgi:hypothetical protein
VITPVEHNALAPYYDELVVWATPEASKADLIEAKRAYFASTGEVFEDDKQFEMRMASFLEHYVLDRPSPSLGLTPARACYLAKIAEGTPERSIALRALTETVHALFEVKKLEPGKIRVVNLFSDVEYAVTERRHFAGLTKRDVLEARLVQHEQAWFFTTASCWHPPLAAPLLVKEAKKRRKKNGNQPPVELIAEAAQRSLKADRYRNIAIEKIYDFG